MIKIENHRVLLEGDWTIKNVPTIEDEIKKTLKTQNGQFIEINGSEITHLDTSGAYLIHKLSEQLSGDNNALKLVSFSEDHSTLIAFIDQRFKNYQSQPEASEKKTTLLEKIGKRTYQSCNGVLSFLSFMGEIFFVFLGKLKTPWKLRWKTLWANVETGGLQALFIIGLLNFLVGLVIAYQGGALLKSYGANIFIVELISISMLRELAPLMTAIIVAGRTGSAFAAQIGTMMVNEEVDALRTIGINPLDQLVLPKIIALMIALPFLTIFADILSVFGGMVLAQYYLDIPFSVFIDRIPQVMTINTFLVGVAKTPLFAIIIALTGCYQGFKVKGGADSVGRQTTVSVVQSIFLVIICDAVFSILTRDIPI